MTLRVVDFGNVPSAKAAEALIVNAIKEAVYTYSEVITVAQALGCLEIAKQEIYEEAK